MKRTILCAAILSATCSVSAGERELVLHAASWHMGVPGYNQFNPGLGIRLTPDNWMYSAGVYKNSLAATALYAGVGHKVYHAGRYTLNLQAGVATGYGAPVVPFVLPELTYNMGSYKVVVEYFPKVKIGSFQTHQGFGFSVAVPF